MSVEHVHSPPPPRGERDSEGGRIKEGPGTGKGLPAAFHFAVINVITAYFYLFYSAFLGFPEVPRSGCLLMSLGSVSNSRVPLMMGACSDSSACPPWLISALGACCTRAGALLPAKMRRRRVGCGTGDSHKYWLNLEPCGLICASLTWCIVLYCETAVAGLTLGTWYADAVWLGRLHFTLFTILATLGLTSHARAMLSNPGACPKNSHPTTSAGWAKTCQKCENHKPPRAHHCSICGRCIIKMGEQRGARLADGGADRDCVRRACAPPLIVSQIAPPPHTPTDHHCPWVNNCVGLANHKFFLLFLLYIFLISMYAIALVIGHFVTCVSADVGAGACSDPTAMQFVTVVSLCSCAILFGLFTGCMMVDQSSVITTGLTQIDRYHAPSPPLQAGKDDRADALAEIFGGDPARDGFKIHWLLPTPIVYKDPERTRGWSFRSVPKPRSSEEVESLL